MAQQWQAEQFLGGPLAAAVALLAAAGAGRAAVAAETAAGGPASRGSAAAVASSLVRMDQPRASAPIGSQAGCTIGGLSSAAWSSAGSAERRAAISKTYSSNHESFIV